MELEEAKKVILDHLDDICTVKNTKWVYIIHSVSKVGEYREVDAGYTEKEMDIMRRCRYIDMKEYFKLRELIDDLI
ncbi:hypothetical protein LCGC14_1094370 [marine sediment metagenome]|uniref:Uncharacterized protein n=1 Tax=marine sediment metagenome TaxID=412755 RepID=A0A0F9QHD4_9ZZZZ